MDTVNTKIVKEFCSSNGKINNLKLLSDNVKNLFIAYASNSKNTKKQLASLVLSTLKRKFKDTYTITFGDQAENNVGMQKIGHLADAGFSCKELTKIYEHLKDTYIIEFINLSSVYPSGEEKIENACILIFRNFYSSPYSADELYNEQKKLNYDTKALMRGRVVNKHARHNLVFGNKSQEPDYESGKGRIYAYKDVPELNKLKIKLPTIFGEKSKNLVAEGNHYYDVKKNGIGFHGDSERKKVIAIRLGATIPLHYQWFLNGKPIGERVKLSLNHGDMYIMSEKAVGYDWKKRKIPTLRHAAGSDKYLIIKKR